MRRHFTLLFCGCDEAFGDLAVTEVFLEHFLRRFIGVESLEVRSPVGVKRFPVAVRDVNALLGRSSHPRKRRPAFVIAGVQEPVCLLRSTGVKKPFRRRSGEPKYKHWIVITGKVEEDGKDYAIPVWSWAKPYRVRITRRLAASYLHTLIFGSFPRGKMPGFKRSRA